jgi:hypothetical protein
MHPIRLLALLAAFALPAQAQHAHGEGKLDIVIDKDGIAINLELPLDAAVGFERAPKNDKEKAALAAADKTLKDAAAVHADLGRRLQVHGNQSAL